MEEWESFGFLRFFSLCCILRPVSTKEAVFVLHTVQVRGSSRDRPGQMEQRQRFKLGASFSTFRGVCKRRRRRRGSAEAEDYAQFTRGKGQKSGDANDSASHRKREREKEGIGVIHFGRSHWHSLARTTPLSSLSSLSMNALLPLAWTDLRLMDCGFDWLRLFWRPPPRRVS